MKPRTCWRKGAILLQTLVMSVILSMIAVMVVKWVFSRYIIANRVQQSARNTAISTGYAMSHSSTWAIPSNASSIVNGKSVSFTQTSGGTFRRFSTTVTDNF